MVGETLRAPRAGDAEEKSALLLSVLNFYEQFAHRNEMNSGLKAEAARAYFKVGSLLERLDRFEEAEPEMARAFAMFGDLVAEFPRVVEYRAKLVEIAIMTDPWSVDPPILPALETRLVRAREVVDQLAGEDKGNLDHVQSQIHVYAKLGAVMQRLDRTGEAELAYRRAIEFAGSLTERSSSPARATIDRADVREALALLLLERGERTTAAVQLDGAVGDLRLLQGSRHIWPMLFERFASLAEGFRKLGDMERARAVEALARPEGGRRGSGERTGLVGRPPPPLVPPLQGGQEVSAP
jgi:eukaryotic-like serine/threonine-protein kinase